MLDFSLIPFHVVESSEHLTEYILEVGSTNLMKLLNKMGV